MPTGWTSERVAAARITPAPAAISRVVCRPSRNVSHVASTAARLSGSVTRSTTTERVR
jgi:hypothetical protein